MHTDPDLDADEARTPTARARAEALVDPLNIQYECGPVQPALVVALIEAAITAAVTAERERLLAALVSPDVVLTLRDAHRRCNGDTLAAARVSLDAVAEVLRAPGGRTP